jgi:hypothetical protein
MIWGILWALGVIAFLVWFFRRMFPRHPPAAKLLMAGTLAYAVVRTVLSIRRA